MAQDLVTQGFEVIVEPDEAKFRKRTLGEDRERFDLIVVLDDRKIPDRTPEEKRSPLFQLEREIALHLEEDRREQERTGQGKFSDRDRRAVEGLWETARAEIEAIKEDKKEAVQSAAQAKAAEKAAVEAAEAAVAAAGAKVRTAAESSAFARKSPTTENRAAAFLAAEEAAEASGIAQSALKSMREAANGKAPSGGREDITDGLRGYFQVILGRQTGTRNGVCGSGKDETIHMKIADSLMKDLKDTETGVVAAILYGFDYTLLGYKSREKGTPYALALEVSLPTKYAPSRKPGEGSYVSRAVLELMRPEAVTRPQFPSVSEEAFCERQRRASP